ncbi:MAG: Tpl protein [Candidatus Cloacimonetes bacterium]|nr:Tpl protein [Candidatus Cloacimonadota bacterium]
MENVNTYVEVEYRNGRTGFYTNPRNFELTPDQWVIVEVERGFDVARVVHASVISKSLDTRFAGSRPACIARQTNESDHEKLDRVIENEAEAAEKFRQMVPDYSFEMKLIKAVYQFDGNKLTFFFTADGRVDFREFVRALASHFRTRIELHQTTGREVAKEIGGIGLCGKCYCCSTYLKHFSQITIKMAKDQNLSGNLSKISGPCGRLLCCLNYEENYYAEVASEFPAVGERVRFRNEDLSVFKCDYFNSRIYLSKDDQVVEIINLEQYKKLKEHERDEKCDT